MGRFKASVQYREWHGTAAATDVEKINLERLLRSEGKMDRETEFLVGVELYVGEDYGGRMRIPQVRALIAEGRSHDDVVAWLKRCDDPIPLRAVDVAVTMEEFAGLFKHLSLVLTRDGLGLEGREYETHE